jgi:SpoVK/Ycf46/Vps4 family AAA+-type ATPase
MGKTLFGLENERQRIKKAIEFMWDTTNHKKRNFLQIQPTLLLTGPPGTGKTTLITALATEYESLYHEEGFFFIRTNLNNLLSHNLGQSSKNLSTFFKDIRSKASGGKRVLVHLDDAESAFSSRLGGSESKGIFRFVTTALEEFDNLFKHEFEMSPVIVLSTNSGEVLDPAIKRRFTNRWHINPQLTDKDIQLMCKEYLGIKVNEYDSLVQNMCNLQRESATPHTFCRVLEATIVQQLTVEEAITLLESELRQIIKPK